MQDWLRGQTWWNFYGARWLRQALNDMLRTWGGRGSVASAILIPVVAAVLEYDSRREIWEHVSPTLNAIALLLGAVFVVCVLIAPARLERLARVEGEAVERERRLVAERLDDKQKRQSARLALGHLLEEGNALREEFRQTLMLRDYAPELPDLGHGAWERCEDWQERVLAMLPEVDVAGRAVFLDDSSHPRIQFSSQFVIRDNICNWLERRTAKLVEILGRSPVT